MISSWLAGTGVVNWQLVAVVVFFAIFIGVLAWIYRPDSARQYKCEAQLPFDDASRSVADGAVASEETHG